MLQLATTCRELTFLLMMIRYQSCALLVRNSLLLNQSTLLQITYFGLIKQKTGEDWNEAKLFLSTAQPSVGGVVPVLPSQTVNFKVPVVER